MGGSLKETSYEKRIQRLMLLGEDGDQYGLYIDISNNIVWEVKNPEQACWEGETGRAGGVTAWLKKQIYPYIMDNEEEQKFRRTFMQGELLRLFQSGQRQVQLGYRFRKGKYITYYHVNIEMFEHPRKHTIECCAIWRNDTIPYVNRVISKVLLQDKYRMIAVLDIQEKTVFVRKHTFDDMELVCDQPLEYREFIEKLCEHRVEKKDRDWFVTSTRLDYMEENLQMAGTYSLTVYNEERGAERYTYRWLDKEYREVLIAVEDRTVEMEKDPLTGYLNRSGFLRKTEHILKKNADQYQFAVIYFNIRKFSGLNDVYGYENGDKIIRSYMDRIQNSVLRPLALGRVSADRFHALVDVKNLELSELGKLLQYPVRIRGEQVEIYGRCGIYYIPEHCDLDVSQMCDLAKMAKNKISNQYMQPYEIYQENMKTEYGQKNLALLNLEKALEQEEFVVCYQPVVDGQTGEIVSAEALVRWNSSGAEPMVPSVFVPELEDSGYITKLDTYIDQTVHRFQEERYCQEKRMVPVAVNLSRMDLMDGRMTERIFTEIQETKVPKQYFRYEIIESACTIISTQGEEFLESLRQQGVQIFLDDFGTGVSTFETVRDYTFDALKLDMGFVKKIGKDQKSDAIVVSIIDLAHRMGMKVVAEGIENQQQSDFLRAHGCDYLQGFYYYKPMSAEKFSKLLDK
ncbi:GGDEF domain-containing phosphodiesterase [Blautia faecicola]|uniref:GGDEF domain-containing protein n=1 Tax=Blautia faecicola TaxID=2509240 RepID=A0A4Q1RIC3_9FIRM|nr:GGDEF domain-containing phosphodiesterase [Blautia faecicola]RXS75378.1 GGDEF domain-containing protein [Blautia faecicola]